MRKYLFFLCITLYLYNGLYAMELAPFIDNRGKQAESDYTAFLRRIVALPKEIQTNIVAKMMGFGGKVIHPIPIKLAYKFWDEISLLTPHCPLTFGNKRLTDCDVWRLPEKLRLKLMQDQNSAAGIERSGDVIFTESEQKEIIDTLPLDIQSGLSITVVQDKGCCNGYGFYILPAPVFCVGVVCGIIYLATNIESLGIVSLSSMGVGVVGCLAAKVITCDEKDITNRVNYEKHVLENYEKDVVIQISEDDEENEN